MAPPTKCGIRPVAPPPPYRAMLVPQATPFAERGRVRQRVWLARLGLCTKSCMIAPKIIFYYPPSFNVQLVCTLFILQAYSQQYVCNSMVVAFNIKESSRSTRLMVIVNNNSHLKLYNLPARLINVQNYTQQQELNIATFNTVITIK